MKNKPSTLREMARAHAKRVLGDDQFKNNKYAADSIAGSWITGFMAGQTRQLERTKPKIDSFRAFCLAHSGLALIAKERIRSIQEEGYDSAHDDGHNEGDLADAAAVYALSDVAMSIL